MPRIPSHRVATHPGVFLREQIEEEGLTARDVAGDTGLPEALLCEIVCERHGVSAETAIALGEYFGQTPQFWMNAQMGWELSKELLENGARIRARVRRRVTDRTAA